jgi:hypothetical protein
LPVALLDCSIGGKERREKEKRKYYKEGIMNGRMDLIADGWAVPPALRRLLSHALFVPRM